MRLLVQHRHVQVVAGTPLALRDALQPRRHEHEGRFPVGEGADREGEPCVKML